MFFDNAKIILADLNAEERKANEKTIAKIIIVKLPKKLKITKDMLNTKPKLKQLKYLEELTNDRNWSLEDEKTSPNPVAEHIKTRVKKLTCNKISDKRILEIKVLFKDKSKNQFMMVQGCPDTGTPRNIGSYQLMKLYILREENPRMITQITFQEDSFSPIYKVTRIHIMLQKDKTKKDLGSQLVFLTNNKNWKDLLNGKMTLNADEIQLAFTLADNDAREPNKGTIKSPPPKPKIQKENSSVIKPQEVQAALICEPTCLIYPAPLRLAFYYHSSIKVPTRKEISVKKLEAIPLSRVRTTYLDDLAEAEEKEIDIKRILVSNILEEIPEPFQEIGLGEAEIKEMGEKALLLELIEDHMKECCLKDDEKERLMLLIASGIVKKKNPKFGSPVFVVPKKIKKPAEFAEWNRGKKKAWKAENLLHRYRMVVNMKKLNDYTIRSPLDLPNLERQMRHLRGTRYYILFDILSGLDFLPTQETSQEIFTLVTRNRAYTMLGAPMGWCNTPQLFTERAVTEVIRDHFNRDEIRACCWLDDIIHYSDSLEGLFNMTSQILDYAIEKRVRFYLKKCEWVMAETVWCGRRLFEGKWIFSEEYFDKIAKAPFPNTKHELAQIIYLANWLRPAIPKMTELRLPFALLINLEGKKLKKVEKMQIKVEWTNDLRANFRKLLEEIAKAAKLVFEHYDRDKPLLLFTDASGETWSLALLQDEPENVTNAIKILRSKPLLFLSGVFNDSQKK
eukprot:augustus_masked-scaffold_117-processed-gene-0.12-mRNA-1 protein AED:1.00 eAED:1.00 QI:0/0/0/0/1/1/4/0/734